MNCIQAQELTQSSNCTQTLQCQQALRFNGDIAGTGVRLSFYLQNFILVLLVDRSYEDAETALWTFIATSFGLTVAALVQVGSGSLTLLEGILVSQLSWLANLGTFLALASYSRSKGEDNLVKIAAVLQGYLSMILTIVMWAWSDSLPPGYSCNQPVKFVFLFAVNVPALGTGRVLALVFSCLVMLIYTAVTFTECMAWRKNGMSRLSIREIPQAADPEIPKLNHHTRRGSGSSTRPSGHKRNKSGTSQSRRRHPSRQQWLGTDVDPIFFGIFLTQVIIFAYFISTTELIVTQTNAEVSDTNKWGFGQVLALTVVIPSAIALVQAMRRNRIAKLNNKEKEKKEDEALNAPTSPREGGTSDSARMPPSQRLQLSMIPSTSLDGGDRLSPGALAPPSLLTGRGSSVSSNSTAHLPSS